MIVKLLPRIIYLTTKAHPLITFFVTHSLTTFVPSNLWLKTVKPCPFCIDASKVQWLTHWTANPKDTDSSSA